MSAEPTREAVVKPCAYCGSSVIGHTPTECIITLRARVDVLERERDDRESLVRELRVTNASAQKALASLRAEADAMRAVVREADALRSLLKRAKKWVRDDTLYDDIENELLYKRDGLDAARRAADAGGAQA